MYRTGNTPPLLADLVDMDSPAAVLDEVLFIMTLITPQMDPTRLTNAFNFAAGLYGGRWPGERECNTGFHDFRHITDTFLAMARLIHGAILNGHMLNEKQIYAGLVSAILHDAGYIQDADDGDGTGAKYTTVHVQRSMDFVQRYGQRYGLTQSEIPDCRQMILCTDLGIDIPSLSFSSPRVELLGKLLGCADLIGQMADRIYLEKLFYLYREFEEGKVLDYADEMDLLAKTLSFFPLSNGVSMSNSGGPINWPRRILLRAGTFHGICTRRPSQNRDATWSLSYPIRTVIRKNSCAARTSSPN